MPETEKIAVSVMARLKNEADKAGEPFNPLLSRYVGFRFLYRLSISPYKDRFVLKGATMFLFWTGSAHRTTRDLDLLSLSDVELSELERIFREVCQIPCSEDGVTFDSDSLEAQAIREEQPYGGSRLTLLGRIGNSRIPLQVDIGIGDAVTPSVVSLTIPSIISNVPEGMVQGYPVESAIAEKFQAMVVLGMKNSRMKDFFDIAYLADTMEFDMAGLRAAVLATFRRRRTPLPQELPIPLSDAFRTDPMIEVRWRAFVKKNSITHPFSELDYVQGRISSLLLPTLSDVWDGEGTSQHWIRGSWRPGSPE